MDRFNSTDYNYFERILETELEKAWGIHKNTIVADGHSDFPAQAYENDSNIVTGLNCKQISLAQMLKVNHRLQCAACYTPEKYFGELATNYARKVITNLLSLTDKNEDKLEVIRSKKQLEKYSENKTNLVGFLIWLESASPFAGELRIAEEFVKLGLRGVGLTHNPANEAGFGCYTNSNNGLTRFGKDLVKYLELRNIIIDLAHINEAGFYNVLELTEKPMVVSHTGIKSCRGENTQRLLTDKQVKEIAQRQGIVGIDYYPSHIGRQVENGKFEATLDDVFAVLDYVVELVGDDFVGLGSDFDGFLDLTQGIECVAHEPLLTARMLKAGYPENSIRKILSGNWLRVFYLTIPQ